MTTCRRTLALFGATMALGALASCAGKPSGTQLNLPETSGGDCATVARAAQAELDTWVTWQVASDAADKATGDYMNGKADYRVSSDADAKQKALGDQFLKESITLVNENVRAGRNCPAVMTAHDQLRTARDLVQHKAAGAAADLSAAEAAWAAAFQTATS